jgi:hypothetical protein
MCIFKNLNPLNHVTSNTGRMDLQLTTVLHNYKAGRGFLFKWERGDKDPWGVSPVHS